MFTDDTELSKEQVSKTQNQMNVFTARQPDSRLVDQEQIGKWKVNNVNLYALSQWHHVSKNWETDQLSQFNNTLKCKTQCEWQKSLKHAALSTN